MATNAAPIYGKQYIRYAETWEALTNAQVGSPVYNRDIAAGIPAADAGRGQVEVGELRVVAPVVDQNVNKAAPPNSLAAVNWTGLICGVNQAYMPTGLARPLDYRELTVATSGLLLVEVEPDPQLPTPPLAPVPLNTQLRVNINGQALPSGGTLVTLDGTTPLIRETVNIGGRKLVLVSFA